MIETERLIAPATENTQEEVVERALRPKVLDEYVGQEKARSQLEIFINAARGRSEAVLSRRCQILMANMILHNCH